MTLSLQEISDRLEIQDLFVQYGYAMEGHNWDVLDDVFAEDAIIDYTDLHGTRGDLQARARRPALHDHLVRTLRAVLTSTARS